MSSSSSSSSESFDNMIQNDLQLLWSIQDYCYNEEWINKHMLSIVSIHPWKDVCSIIWVFFMIGVVEIKTKHFFVVSMNLFVCYIARKLIRAKRPVEYDTRLKPLTDWGEDSYGFPSVESYMSVVIMLHITYSWSSILFLPIAIFVIFIVGFSRIYARSRFPHQIVGSWIAGLIGLIVSIPCCENMNFHNMSSHHHGVCVGVVVVFVVINFTLAMESNESRLLYMPKSEFIRVLRTIIDDSNSSTTVDDANGSDAVDENLNGKVIVDDMYTTRGVGSSVNNTTAKRRITQIASESVRSKLGKHAKKDSFYFMQQTVMRRDEEKKALIKQWENGNRIQMNEYLASSSTTTSASINLESSSYNRSNREYTSRSSSSYSDNEA